MSTQSLEQLLVQICNIRVLRQQRNSIFELIIPDFRVMPGQFIAVTGESGCGKSTLLDLLALVLQPRTGGSFLLRTDQSDIYDIGLLWRNGKENSLSTIRRKAMGYVPQSGGLLPFLSLRDNVYLPPRLNQQAGYKKRLSRMSMQLGIANLMDRMPRTLSGGQRQRGAILRAMAHQPKLILADEPTAAVDSARAARIVSQFHQIAASQNTAIVMVTHDTKLVASGCDVHYSFLVDASNEDHVVSTCEKIS